MSQLSLYGTSACHLCEVAETPLQNCRSAVLQFEYVCVDISESERLFERYGLSIPVLRHPDGGELLWPFSEAQLRAFLCA